MYSHDKKPLPHLQGGKQNDRASGQSRGAMDLTGLSSTFGNQAMLSLLGMSDRQGPAIPTTGRGGSPLSDTLREKFERRFGFTLDDVRVHYNSDKPAELGAAAYTYGTDVFIGPEQEKSLDHELAHVVQQKQGIVRPTEYRDGVPLNTSVSLEHSADMAHIPQGVGGAIQPVVQCDGYADWKGRMGMWCAALNGLIGSIGSVDAARSTGEMRLSENAQKNLLALIQMIDGSVKNLGQERGQDLAATIIRMVKAKLLFEPGSYRFASVSNAEDAAEDESEGAGSLYFGGNAAINPNETNALTSIWTWKGQLRNIRKMLQNPMLDAGNRALLDAQKNDLKQKISKAAAPMLRSAQPGARIRLLHPSGPEISYHDKLHRGLINTSEGPALYELFSDTGSSEARGHQSRGVPDRANDYELELDDLNQLFYAASYAQATTMQLSKGADDAGKKVAAAQASSFLHQYIQEYGSEKLKKMPINQKSIKDKKFSKQIMREK